MEFKFDVGNAMAPLYAAVPGVAFSLGNTEVAFHVHADGAVHVMSGEVERALGQCRQFRTLSEHVTTIVERNPALAGKRAAVQGVLEHLARIGVLVPGADLIARLSRDGGNEPAPLRAVVVRAGGDAEALAATFASAHAHEQRTGTKLRWIVVGDGAGEAARARAAGLDAAQLDATRIAQLAGGADLGTINETLLLGAGARIAAIDAGTRFDFRRHASARERLSLPRVGNVALDLCDSPEDAASLGQPDDADAFATAASWCGRTLGAVVARGLVLDAAGLSGHALGHPGLESSTRVVGVDFAVRGHPRGEDPAFPFNLRGEAREQLWRSRERYDAQRRMACLATHPVDVRTLGGTASVPVLLDATALLPPTWGEGPAAERLFGALLRHLHPEAILLRSASTLARAAPPRPASAAHTPALQDLLADLAAGAHGVWKSDDPAPRLARYAMHVRDLAEAPTRRRLETLSAFVAQRRAAHLTQLQNDLESSSGAPGWWGDEMRDAIFATGRPLMAHTTPRLAGWPEALDEAGCAERLGAELAAFASLCERWPELWAGAAASAEAIVAGA